MDWWPSSLADMPAIRQGLAAALARGIDQCKVWPYFMDDPKPPALTVAGPELTGFQTAFGDDASFLWIVEGCAQIGAGLAAAQQIFDEWVDPNGARSVNKALLDDYRLNHRLDMEGNLTEDVGPAADSVALVEFRGYRRQHLPKSGVEVLLGDFAIQVETS